MTKRKQTTEAAEAPQPRMERVLVTPQRALEWLALSVERPRVKRLQKIAAFARDMREGKWRETFETIKFSKGKMVDGQHRILACIEADTPFVTWVGYDMPEESTAVLDSGTSRSLADYLHFREEKDAKVLAAVIRLTWAWYRGHLQTWAWKSISPSNEESIAWFEQHPELRETMPIGLRLRRPPLYITQSVGCAFWWHAHGRFPQEVEHFLDQLIKGEDLSAGHPVLAFRRLMGNIQAGETRVDQRSLLAHLLKTFIATQEGRSLRVITWKPASNERFPELPKSWESYEDLADEAVAKGLAETVAGLGQLADEISAHG